MIWIESLYLVPNVRTGLRGKLLLNWYVKLTTINAYYSMLIMLLNVNKDFD